MADDIWDDENILDELADSAKLFEEIASKPARDDIGDILFVEGIEEDEQIVEEDPTPEDEFVTPKRSLRTLDRSRAPQRKGIGGAQTHVKKRSIAIARKQYNVPGPAPVLAASGDITIGNLFASLVRHSPSAKIRIRKNTIGTLFRHYIGQV